MTHTTEPDLSVGEILAAVLNLDNVMSMIGLIPLTAPTSRNPFP